jgi:hypothetical protein
MALDRKSTYSPNGRGVLSVNGDATWKDRFYDFSNPTEWIDQGGLSKKES